MIKINRTPVCGEYSLPDIFPGLQENPILLEIFGSSDIVDDVFSKTKVIISDKPRYMKVDNEEGSILVGRRHLLHSDAAILYLDSIHELVHVKQHREGLDLYDRSRAYVDRKTEVDAYEVTVNAARRIGFTDGQIFDYLRVEWITPEEHQRLAEKLNVIV